MALKPNEQELLDRVQSGLGIGGKWEPSATRRDPGRARSRDRRVIKSIADATVEDAVRALDAAVAAQDSWAATPSRAALEHPAPHLRPADGAQGGLRCSWPWRWASADH